MNLKRKALAALTAMSLAATLTPIAAFAEDTAITDAYCQNLASGSYILDGQNISGNGSAGISIAADAEVTIELEGASTVTGDTGYAGIYVPVGATLTITDDDNDGSLTVTGGASESSSSYVCAGAGIGGNGWTSSTEEYSFGSIIINGGTITANGGNQTAAGLISYGAGAGIGTGGMEGNNLYNYGSITINGGTITANGGSSDNINKYYLGGAGIGTGAINGNGYNSQVSITINGGEITATGGWDAAGIGTGANGVSDGTITISGGTVTANGGSSGGAYGGSGIGGGDNGAFEVIIITGDADVTADAGGGAAAVGCGHYVYGGSVEISGNATVTATSSDDYVSIGNGYPRDSYEADISINTTGTVTVAVIPNVALIEYTDNGNGTYTLGSAGNVSDEIEVVFTQVGDSAAYEITLASTDGTTLINRFSAAQLQFAIDVTEGSVGYTITAADGINLINAGDDFYEFNLADGSTQTAAASVLLGTVTFTGVGKANFAAVYDADAQAHSAETSNNIVNTYIPGGGTGYGTLDLNGTTGSIDTDDETALIKDISVSLDTVELTINVVFPNSVENKVWAYEAMEINLSNVSGDDTIYLGSDAANTNATVAYGTATIGTTDYTAYVVTTTVPKAYATKLEFVGAGYRTYRTSITPTDDATVTVWNNAMDSEDTVVISADDNAMGIVTDDVTFLAGDIVMDNNINIWDLSAVVSYFGKAATDAELEVAWDYTMYDLNRDGKVDSRDIAMVLVSWDK
ncbi:MAG: dockerin type I domain-containing protein [Firmicutes bacterium]|nr:dockerin type I domain-containing protein [Bacillota bacterium]